MTSKYGEDYRHFDTLIWQLPTWSIALFTGVLTAIWVIVDTGEEHSFVVDKATIIRLILLASTFALLTMSYTLFRFRCHQRDIAKTTLERNTSASYHRFSRYLGAQNFLQVSVNLEAAILLGLLLGLVISNRDLVLALSIDFFAAITIVFYIVPLARGRTIFEDKNAER